MPGHTLIQGDILYRDDSLLILNKPAGVPVHGGRILEDDPETLLSLARDLTGKMVHAVHRLDRPVSGANLLTFDKATLAALGLQFEQRRIRKKYLAISRGWLDDSGTIDYPLLPPRDERKASSTARPAVTLYRCLGHAEVPADFPPYATARYSLLELEPQTGRRHQLRRHLKHVSHHLAGDTTYGRGEHNRLFRERFACNRLLLHSLSLEFDHPESGHELRIEAPLDAAFTSVLKSLGWTGLPGLPAGIDTAGQNPAAAN